FLSPFFQQSYLMKQFGIRIVLLALHKLCFEFVVFLPLFLLSLQYMLIGFLMLRIHFSSFGNLQTMSPFSMSSMYFCNQRFSVSTFQFPGEYRLWILPFHSPLSIRISSYFIDVNSCM